MTTSDQMIDMLHARKRALGLSYTDLSVLAGVGKSTIVEYMTDRHQMRADHLLRLLNALSLEVRPCPTVKPIVRFWRQSSRASRDCRNSPPT